MTEGTKVAGDFLVTYEVLGKEFSQSFPVTVEINNRNAMTWDDDRKAASFVTAKDPAVLGFSKNTVSLIRSDYAPPISENFRTALALFQTMSVYGIGYAVDPATPFTAYSSDQRAVDFLQFPNQTLSYKAGDCDDISVLYAVLLEAVGIPAAFITTPGHIFIAFDMGITPEQAERFFDLDRDVILHEDRIWMPVEITLVKSGFLDAWRRGAQEWNEAVRAEAQGIDPDSFDGNIIVRYNGDSEGTNRVTGEWEIEYDSTLRRLTIDADPWLSSGKTVTVTVGNIKAADGSELLEPVVWSFSTNNRAAFNLTIDAEYANGANYTNIPVTLEFSSTANLYYYLTSNSVTTETAATSFNPATWTQVTSTEMTDHFSYSSQGISVPLYLWVYENGGAGILSTNNTTESEYLLVDYTPPSGTFSLPSIAYSSSVAADMSGISDNVSGIAKYEFSNDGSSSTWTEYPDPETTVPITIRDNAGPRTVYCRATDNVGNVMVGAVSASTNYYLPVKITLTDITVSDADFLALTEQWYWAFSINGSDAFSRSSTTPLSYGVSSAKKITSAAAAYIDKIRVDKNSAIPYTTTRYVDVASSVGTVVMTGYVAEEDGKIDQITDTNWFYYLSTNARTLSLSTDPGSPATGSYALTADTLSGISIGIDYWATVEYAATGP